MIAVIGLTSGSAAKASRPSAASAASAATRAACARTGACARRRPARGEHERDDQERRELPAHVRTSASRPPGAARRVVSRPSPASSAAPCSGSSAPPAPPRMRAVSVAKYQPPASSSAVGAVGDHAPVGEQHRALGEVGGELGVVRGHDHGLALLGSTRAARARARPWRRGPCRAWARRARARAGGSPPGDDREREALALAAREVARVALAPAPASPTCRERLLRAPPRRRARGSGSRRGSAAAARPGRRARTRPACRLEQAGGVAQQRRLARAVASHQRDALAGAQAAARRRAGSPGPSRSSCHTPRSRSAGLGSRAQRRAPPRDAGARRRCRPTLAARSARGGPAPSGRAAGRRAQGRARLLDAGRRRAQARAARTGARAGVCSAGSCSAAHSRKPRGSPSHTIAPPSHRDHAVGGRQAALEAVLDEQHGGVALLVEPAQLPDQLVAGDGVELRGGLVEQHERAACRRAPRASATRCSSPPESSCGGAVEQVGDAERERGLLDRARDRARRRGRGSRARARARRARVLITTCVSGSWKSTPACAADVAGAVLARVEARDVHAARRSGRRGSAARARRRRAAASTCRRRRAPRARRTRPARSRGSTSRSARARRPDSGS